MKNGTRFGALTVALSPWSLFPRVRYTSAWSLFRPHVLPWPSTDDFVWSLLVTCF